MTPRGRISCPTSRKLLFVGIALGAPGHVAEPAPYRHLNPRCIVAATRRWKVRVGFHCELSGARWILCFTQFKDSCVTTSSNTASLIQRDCRWNPWRKRHSLSGSPRTRKTQIDAHKKVGAPPRCPLWILKGKLLTEVRLDGEAAGDNPNQASLTSGQ